MTLVHHPSDIPIALPTTRRRRTIPRSFFIFTLELALAILAAVISVIARPWLDRLGDTRYQEFLRMQLLLVTGGKGFQFDILSLPLPPMLYVGTATLFGTRIAETWLPVAVSVGTVLVLTRVLLRGYPFFAKLLAAIPLLASPYFYLVQRQLDLQLFVLLLGLQLSTLRAFRQRPTVVRVSAAVGLNILLSLTSYAAIVALVATVVYLLVIAEHQREVASTAWRAMLWLYLPFSLCGYALWAVFWVVAGSRVKTSFFLPVDNAGAESLRQLLRSTGGELALPLVILFGLAVALWVFLRQPEHRQRGGLNQALAWSVIAFMGIALVLLGLRAVAQVLLVQPEAITFSLVLLVPVAVVSLYSQVRAAFLSASRTVRLLLVVAGLAVIAVFPLHFVLRPAMQGQALIASAPRVFAARAAAAQFGGGNHDPGGRVLADPRFTASFLLDSRIDPRRLLTPFDKEFKDLVVNPPEDVRITVVSESLDDYVSGNYPTQRLMDTLPDATLLAEGKTEGAAQFVRVFERHLRPEPTEDAPPVSRGDPALTQREDEIYAAVRAEMDKRGGLPLRPDGWAYAVDVGNLMLYAAERGEIELFRQLSDVVRRDYLITRSNDRNALYTVAWRFRRDRPVEASGTTETLRMVEAYWIAGERWNNEYYHQLAWAMAKAYVRHEWSDEYGEGWYIRNYYNYETKAYATNTFLVDYAPDVLRRVADGMRDTDLRKTADKAADFVVRAQVPFGYFHEMYQPEIATLYDNITYFSPNGVLQIIDSHEAALGISELYAPGEARRTYEFSKAQHLSPLGIRNQYQMNGAPNPGGEGVTAAVYAFVARLSTRMGDLQFSRQLIDETMTPELMYADTRLTPDRSGTWFFAWSTALLAQREYQNALP